MAKKQVLWFLVALGIGLTACNDNQKESPATGSITIHIRHTVDGNPLITDSLMYTNEAGNHYLINEIQWFISDISLVADDGSNIALDADNSAYYVDTDIPESMRIQAWMPVPAGHYKGIAFTFGLDEANNISNRFVNPPESFMFWPEYLGGGYHYMKLNGKWINEDGLKAPFNFHLGTGQIYTGSDRDILFDFGASNQYLHCEGFHPPQKLSPVVAFVPNYFRVNLTGTDASLIDGGNLEFIIEMQVENWFRTPNTYDHNVWGGSIMQQQDALKSASENGHDVFIVKPLN
ncbi:MAG: hypothetical protein KGZ82_00135 [Bacteroidales bacterium]|nr:hypothetical protein [Bacteroidales bacterium]